MYRLLSTIAAILFSVSATASAQITEAELPADGVHSPEIECESFAPPEELAQADRVALRGVACFEEGKFVQALRHYRRAYEVSESPLLLGAIGRVFEEMGYPALAREYYNSYLLSDVDGKEKIAARLADVEETLEARAVPVRIESSPPGGRVFLVMDQNHWELAGDTPFEARLLPGKYPVVIRREGFESAETTIVVPEKSDPENVSKKVVEVELDDPNAAFDTTSLQWRESGIAVTIASVPFVAAGVTMIALGFDKESDSEALSAPLERDEMLNDASRLKTWGTVSLALGATGAVIGSILYLIGLDSDHVTQNETGEQGSGRITPWASPSAGGATIRF